MFKKTILFLLPLFFFSACFSGGHEKLKISATTWVGYSPLFYAKEKGWLTPLNIKLLNVVSLSENMYLYQAGNADAYVGTQYEYNHMVQKKPSLMPIMMFDRSYGGDIIMSNRSVERLQKTSERIDAYLEMDSINHTLLKDFIQRYGLKDKTINYINKDQTAIASIQAQKTTRPSIIVTYIPYDNQLRQNGFTEIASTKNGLELLVVDAMFTTEKVFHKHKQQFIALKKLVNDAVIALQKDPREFYETVKPYMLEVTYEEFFHSLSDIIWINDKISPELLKRMNEANFPTRDLI